MDDLRVLVFFYIVEGALIGYVGTALIGIRLNLRQVTILGICHGLIVYLVRGIYTVNRIPLGTHSFFLLASLIIIIYFLTRQSWGVCTIAGLLGFIMVALSESLMLLPVFGYLKLTFEQVWADAWTHIILGYVGDWLLILVALVLFFSKKSLVDLENPRK